ncbi:MAG: ArsR family transcriptional regulator [Candidatus Thorarchaeota archaeon]
MNQTELVEKRIQTDLSGMLEQLPIPPSAKKVYTVLHREGPLTSGDLETRCSYSDRTIRNALKRLINLGVVRRVANFQDMRTSLFHVLSTPAA